eukprot:PhM_4_TR4783/c0_g1_i1/m.58893
MPGSTSTIAQRRDRRREALGRSVTAAITDAAHDPVHHGNPFYEFKTKRPDFSQSSEMSRSLPPQQHQHHHSLNFNNNISSSSSTFDGHNTTFYGMEGLAAPIFYEEDRCVRLMHALHVYECQNGIWMGGDKDN